MNIKSAINITTVVAIITVFILIIPMIGENVDDAWTPSAQVKATGTLTFTDQPVEGETFNISSDTYEFDMSGDGVGAGNFDINAGGTLPATLGLAKACINANDTAGVAALNTSTTITLAADDYGYAGNAITTTEGSTKASFGAATLTGGNDGSQWNESINTDITTGSGFWTDTIAVFSIGVLVLIVSGLVLKGLFVIKK